MKHNWNFFQNESADEEKKALLPVLVIPLVVIVLMIVIVLADYGKKRSEEPAAVTETAETLEQEPETMAETGESDRRIRWRCLVWNLLYCDSRNCFVLECAFRNCQQSGSKQMDWYGGRAAFLVFLYFRKGNSVFEKLGTIFLRNL